MEPALREARPAPTSQLAAAVAERLAAMDALSAAWSRILTGDLPAVNGRLRAAGIAEMRIE